MQKRSQRGAARISAVWMIAVIVLFFVALAFGYISQQDLAQARSQTDAAKAAEAEAVARRDQEAEAALNISKAVGYYPKDVVGGRTNIDAAAEGLAQLKARFSDLDDSVQNFEDAVPR